MNFVFLLAVSLLLLINALVLSVYLHERRHWRWVQARAKQSDLAPFDQ